MADQLNAADFVGKELRAFSVFEKAVSGDDERVIRGIATTPTVDRVGDIVDPMGASYAKEVPLLWQHNHNEAIGTVKFGKATKDGIPFEATLPHVEEEGELKKTVDKAWHSVKYGLVRAVSIGFRVLKDGLEFIEETGGLLFTDTEIFELSLVSIPANQDATIDVVRSLVAPARADEPKQDKRSGEAVHISKTFKIEDNQMKTLQEQIDEATASKSAKLAAMDAVIKDADGSTLDAEQAQLHDDAMAEAKALGEHIKRLEARQELEVASATPIDDKGTAIKTVETTKSKIKVGEKALPKGTKFTRVAIATALSKGNPMMAAEIAKQRYADTPEVAEYLKAAVTGFSTADPSVAYDGGFASEFLELLQGRTIFDRIANKRRMPFETKVRVGANAATAYWVGEGAPKPVSKPGLSEVSLSRHKLAALCVMTEESINRTGWASEQYVRDEMVSAVVRAKDEAFIDAAAGTAVRPAAINNGITAVTATGTSGTDFKNDIQSLYDGIIDANLDLSNLVWIMNPKRASRIGNIQNALGQDEYPGVNAMGGNLDGSEIITSTRIADSSIILMKADSIMYAQDDNMILRSSNEASIRMSDDPAADGALVPPMEFTSMFQDNMVALLAEQFVTWIRGRDAGVQAISGAAYT